MICYTTICTAKVTQGVDGKLYATEFRYGGKQKIEWRFQQKNIHSVDFNYKGMIFLNVLVTPSTEMRWDDQDWQAV